MKKHRGARAYRLRAEKRYKDEHFPFEIISCERWFATTQKEARAQLIEWAMKNETENVEIKCSAIARK